MKTKKRPSGVKKKQSRRARYWTVAWTDRKLWQRILFIVIALWLVFYAQVWLISTWYVKKHENEPLHVGVTFIPDYAGYFGLDPHQTMLALRDDIGFKRFRLVSYWDKVEPSPGQYDFSELDWEMNAVDQVNGQVTLSIGMRQPVVNHVKDNKALVSYQLENEYFLTAFGMCKDQPTRAHLSEEFNMVKNLDPSHPVILSLANNYFGIPTGQPRPDQFGISVYKRVWDQTITHRYFEYPFSPRYYAWRSGLTEIFTGRSSMLHELQAEPWPPKDVSVKDASIAEQNKSMDAARLKTRIQYGMDTGYRDIDLWGGEWWYWRKVYYHDDTLWNVIKTEMKAINDTNGHPPRLS
jgi:hypothetical protein